MRRAYVESHLPFPEALRLAFHWAGESATIHAPDTASIDENDLESLGVPVTCASRRSRLYDAAHGTVIGTFLNLSEVLEVERSTRVDGLVVLPAHGPFRFPMTTGHHGPWITAFGAEHLGGQEIPATAPAPASLRAAVSDLTGMAVSNQGLLDKRERSEAIHALTFLRGRGVALDPDALMVEALRNGWGRTGPEVLRQIAIDLNDGKRLQFDRRRLSPARLQQWADADS